MRVFSHVVIENYCLRPEGQNNVITERSPPRLKYEQYMRLQALQSTGDSHSTADGTLLVSIMFTTKPVKKGEQLINNYGCLSEAELLVKYGIVPNQKENENENS